MNNKLMAILVLWALGLLFLTFFVSRADFELVLAANAIVFAAYYLLLSQFQLTERIVFWLLFAGIAIRFISIFAFPLFSDDIYRFWWDGKLLNSGSSPFEHIPRYYIENGIFTEQFDIEIFHKLNSPDYYSVYPPVCQLVFAAAYWFFPKSIYGTAVFIKFILFCFELGTLFYLKQLGVKAKGLLIYALNPLIIIELCGNAHFEAAMIFFLAASLYYLNIRKIVAARPQVLLSSFFLALSISSKLLSLLFLPFLMKGLGWKNGLWYGLSVGVFSILFFFPYYDLNFIEHFTSSVALYFQRFEFNASVFYLFKLVGNAAYGYTPVLLISRLSSILLGVFFIYLFFGKKDFFIQAFFFFTFYLILQRAVHPWYLSTLLFLSVFVPWRFAMIWTGLIMLSYSHYLDNFYQEKYNWVLIEYLFLFGFMFYEYLAAKRQSKLESASSHVT
jgi:alpha-1,6-mannosyltransferase